MTLGSKNLIVASLGVATAAAILYNIGTLSITRSERVECLQLAEYMVDYSRTFYAVPWQAEMCAEYHGIVLSPVRVQFEDGSERYFKDWAEVNYYFAN